MKLEEDIAKHYLDCLQAGTPAYEPDGTSTTPDFSINGEIAVEVTRLTRPSNNTRKNTLEYINILKGVIREINTQDALRPSKTTYVNLEFNRPLPKTKELQQLLKSAILEHGRNPGQKEVVVCENAKLCFGDMPCPSNGNSRYTVAHSDLDESGDIEPMLRKALEHSISSKANNARKRKRLYREWWLILVDFESHCEDPEEQQFAFDVISTMDTSIWNKIVILNGLNYTSQVEYPS